MSTDRVLGLWFTHSLGLLLSSQTKVTKSQSGQVGDALKLDSAEVRLLWLGEKWFDHCLLTES